jgi:hypothetical protein
VARPRGIDRRSRDGGRAPCRRASVTLTPPSPRLPLRLASPTKQLLRRQPVSPRDSRYLFATLIALGEKLRLLLACPRTASARASKHFQPAYRLKLGFGRKLSVRHVSNPLDSPGRNFAHQRSALKVGPEGRLRQKVVVWDCTCWPAVLWRLCVCGKNGGQDGEIDFGWNASSQAISTRRPAFAVLSANGRSGPPRVTILRQRTFPVLRKVRPWERVAGRLQPIFPLLRPLVHRRRCFEGLARHRRYGGPRPADRQHGRRHHRSFGWVLTARLPRHGLRSDRRL